MSLASTGYPFLSVMWSMFVFFAWILWIWLLIYVYMDVFRRHDIGGLAKTGWVVFTILLPFIGVFSYLIFEGRAMGERRAAEAQQAKSDMDAYIRATASGNGASSSADQIERARQLLNSGAITQDEYQALKQKALAS